MSGDWLPAELTSLANSFFNFSQSVPSVASVSVIPVSLEESHRFSDSGKYLPSAWAASCPDTAIELLHLRTGCFNLPGGIRIPHPLPGGVCWGSALFKVFPYLLQVSSL